MFCRSLRLTALRSGASKVLHPAAISALNSPRLCPTRKSGARPVGTACGRNPIPIIIPCHRVLGTQGLGGYSGAGGLETKIALLTLEDADTKYNRSKELGI